MRWRLGLAGRGTSSYIDSVIMRDKDANTAWDAASDATLEERRYYCQNWRADVVALLTAGGDVSEWIRYSAYGEATVYPFVNGDYDGSGGVDGDDVIAFLADQDNNIAAADVDRNGYVDGDDTIAFYASWDNGWMSTAWSAGGGLPSSAGQLSVTSGNRIGYAGYQFDPATEQYHVRHRVYSPEMGRWTRRDPLKWLGATSLIEYGLLAPLEHIDADGLEERCVSNTSRIAYGGSGAKSLQIGVIPMFATWAIDVGVDLKAEMCEEGQCKRTYLGVEAATVNAEVSIGAGWAVDMEEPINVVGWAGLRAVGRASAGLGVLSGRRLVSDSCSGQTNEWMWRVCGQSVTITAGLEGGAELTISKGWFTWRVSAVAYGECSITINLPCMTVRSSGIDMGLHDTFVTFGGCRGGFRACWGLGCIDIPLFGSGGPLRTH